MTIPSPVGGDLDGLRAALADPTSRLLGTFLLVPRVEVVEVIAAAGFDLVVLDCEHGPFGVEALPELLAAARASGVYAVVRVPELHRQSIGAVLDAGADGVLVPHVASAAEARDAVYAARYPTDGIRSLHNAVRGAGYASDPDYLTAADRRSAVLIMCEDTDAVAAVEQTVTVAGLDAVFVGPFDLSAAMGHPGQPTEPSVVETVHTVLATCAAAAVPTGVVALDPAGAHGWFQAGARLVVLGVDTGVLYGAYRTLSDAVRCR